MADMKNSSRSERKKHSNRGMEMSASRNGNRVGQVGQLDIPEFERLFDESWHYAMSISAKHLDAAIADCQPEHRHGFWRDGYGAFVHGIASRLVKPFRPALRNLADATRVLGDIEIRSWEKLVTLSLFLGLIAPLWFTVLEEGERRTPSVKDVAADPGQAADRLAVQGSPGDKVRPRPASAVVLKTRVGKVTLWEPIAAAAAPIDDPDPSDDTSEAQAESDGAVVRLAEAQESAGIILQIALSNSVDTGVEGTTSYVFSANGVARSDNSLIRAAMVNLRVEAARQALFANDRATSATVCGTRSAGSVEIECFPLSTIPTQQSAVLGTGLSMQFSIVDSGSPGAKALAYTSVTSARLELEIDDPVKLPPRRRDNLVR